MEFQDTMPLGDAAAPSRRDAPAAPPPAFAPAPTSHTGPQGLAIEFTGSGSEYFRIWIVNLLLTIVTLGFYFPFAKARRLRYFHGNTLVGGHALGFHGDPWKMLRGYVLMLVFGAAYLGAGEISPLAGAVAGVAFALLWPALWQSSLRFRLANTSWRGLRLRFSGSLGGAYAALMPLLVPVAVIVAAGSLNPEDAKAPAATARAAGVTTGQAAGQVAGHTATQAVQPAAEQAADQVADQAAELADAPASAAASTDAQAAPQADAQTDVPAEAQAEERAGSEPAGDAGGAKDDKALQPRPIGPADYVILGTSFVLLLMLPWLTARLKRYQHGHYQFADETTRLEARTRAFYGLVLRAFGVSLIPLALIGGAFALMIPAIKHGGPAAIVGAGALAFVLILAGYLLLLVLTQSYMTARSQNLVWGGTRSHRLRFSSRLKVRSMVGLMLTNLLLTVVTFGLYRPFAAIATAKLRLEAVSLEAHGDIEQWTAGAARRVNDAAGDAAGDLFGIDVGL